MAIEDILMYDESLFQNINAFDPDYMPQNYNFRDTQMEAMAMSIRPAIRGGKPSNAIVLGSPATGKKRRLYVFILTVRFILLVLEFFHKSTRKYLAIFLRKPVFPSQEFMIKS